MKCKNYQYYVEGEHEKKLVGILKTNFQYVVAGKIEVFNATQQKFTKQKLIRLKYDTVVILIFDTDVEGTKILEENIKFLKSQNNVKEVICITQVKKFEDELIRCCNIRAVTEFTNSETIADFKRDFNKITNLENKLRELNFDINKLWNQIPPDNFSIIKNEADKIKIQR